MKLLRVAPVAGIVLVAGCGHVVRTPAPASPAPTARYGELRAGLARAEITPPMGAGLFGYGPEGKKPEGFRHRLYARALVLEDARGERLAIVVADLGAVSTLLHREVAARLQQAGTRAIRGHHSRLGLHAEPRAGAVGGESAALAFAVSGTRRVERRAARGRPAVGSAARRSGGPGRYLPSVRRVQHLRDTRHRTAIRERAVRWRRARDSRAPGWSGTSIR
jgi:hypothetical protein